MNLEIKLEKEKSTISNDSISKLNLGLNNMKDKDAEKGLQKVLCKNIHPARRYTALPSLDQAGAESPAGVKPEPGKELPAGLNGH